MGILDKVAFWKKKDDFDFGFDKESGKDFGLDEGGGQGAFGQNVQPDTGFQPAFQPAQQPMQPSFPPQWQPAMQPSFQSYPQQDITAKNLEVISSKLDALKAAIESINQRLANIEAIARGEEESRRRRYY